MKNGSGREPFFLPFVNYIGDSRAVNLRAVS
jgi:hypothetical protein